MMYTFQDPTLTASPQKHVANMQVLHEARVTVQVLQGRIRMGDSVADITGQPVSGFGSGMIFTVASTQTPVQFVWSGELWAVGDGPGIAVAVIYMQDRRYAEHRGPTL